MRKWIALLVSFLALPAAAQTVPACAALGTATPIPWNEARLTWVLPTTNTDGSALTPSTVAITVYRSTGTALPVAQCKTANGALGASLLSQPTGTQIYAATARVGTGPESVLSMAATKVIVLPPPVPNPPTSFTVQADLTAWTIVQSIDRVALAAVGTIAPGTTCDATQSVVAPPHGTMYVVPRASVTFAGNVQPQVVLASCG